MSKREKNRGSEGEAPAICVCGVDEMPANVTRFRPSYLISLLQPHLQPQTPRGIHPDRHHRVEIDDIVSPLPDLILPSRHHIDGLVAFLRRSEPSGSLLIHCAAGVSRSPAAALIALVLDAPSREAQAAALLRSVAPHVHPNPLIISLGDAALDRRGALVSAARSMGGGDECVSPTYFLLPRKLPALVHKSQA